MLRKVAVGSTLMILVVMVSSCSAPITTREQGGLIGAGLGAGAGAIIGSTVGHAAAGALIGGPVGLIAGALIGDHPDGPAEKTTGASTADRPERARVRAFAT
jgi:outer membrane lipoprotein SlyB